MFGQPQDIIRFNVGGTPFATQRQTFPRDTDFYKWFVNMLKPVPFVLVDGEFFIDRDPFSFGIILNYFRLRAANQLWEACLPKDPDRLALLIQEAEYFNLPALRRQALSLLQSNYEEGRTNCIQQMKSVVVFALFVACALAASPFVRANVLECTICKDVAADTENYEGHELEKDEPKIIAYCDKEFKNLQAVCEYWLKNNLDKIITHMEDPATDKSDAEKACQEIGFC